LRQLGGDPVVMAAIGVDGADYLQRIRGWGATTDHVRTIDDSYTAQAIIITDTDNNQITAFHPGAMSESHRNRIADANGVKLAIVSPDGRQGMVEHTRDLAAAAIPFVFDPGQGLPMFSGPDLLEMMKGARALAVNDYEAGIVEEKTGKKPDELARGLGAVIVTRGAEGSVIYADGREIRIPPVKADALVDPTGCGDAYRAGLLYGMARQWTWEKCGRLAGLMGSIKIAHRGGQNHRPDRAEIARRFRDAFGEAL